MSEKDFAPRGSEARLPDRLGCRNRQQRAFSVQTRDVGPDPSPAGGGGADPRIVVEGRGAPEESLLPYRDTGRRHLSRETNRVQEIVSSLMSLLRNPGKAPA